jgi:Tol biopolymer transport system component
MPGKLLRYLTLPLLLLLSSGSGDSAPQPSQGAPVEFNLGPDIITGDIGSVGSLEEFGSSGTQVGLGVGTTACNPGNVTVNFVALPQTSHPIVPHNLYRMSGGSGNNDRFEQIGQSWVKHTYGAKAGNDCGFGCTDPGTQTLLGVGCSDTYAGFQNATQTDLGSRALVNPFTGVFQSNANDHTGHTHTGTSHRILVEGSDLNTTLNPGATYYAEVQYISSDEYAWCQTHPGQCNMYNNASYRQYIVTGTTSFVFNDAGPTVRMAAAINAWTGATIHPIEPMPGVDGRAFVAYKVTGPVAGVWHYEYALYNENLDRAIQSFSVPLGCGITVSNLGFHAPLNHPGFPNDGTQGDAGFSNAAWISNQTASEVSWSSETFVQNQNANAIRWGTSYNFRFDSDKPPLATKATIGFFKTGTPVTVAILGPNACNVVPSPTPTVPPSPTPPASPTPTPTPSATPDPIPTPILPPGGNGKIVFERSRRIFVMAADGANQTQLTTTGTADYQPAWSPDGTRIAFVSDRTPPYPNVYVMNANGANQVRLGTNDGGQGNHDPAWSPNGTKIVFVRDINSSSKIYVMNANGSNPVRLTNTEEAREYDPAWSPDGGKIAFVRRVADPIHIGIYLTDPDGSNPTDLTPTTIEATTPAWSPDGAKILFRKSDSIWVMNRDGSQQTRLTSSFSDHSPTWSPDGTKIAFCRGDYNHADIFVMDANGTNPVNITNHLGSETPDWQRVALIPTPTPTPTPGVGVYAINLSTRMRVQAGDNAGIGGFIITGSAPKRVILRAIGPSLTQYGVLGALADPVMELHGPDGFATFINDNWRDTQAAEIKGTFIPPADALESAIVATLSPGAYTAIVSGKGGAAGVALVEVYDLDHGPGAKLANLSTRAFVSTADNIVIAGFLLNGSVNDIIVVRGLGPSLTGAGVPNALANPILELRNGNGSLVVANNDWQDDEVQAAYLTDAGLALTNPLEAGMAAALPPGPYTALLAGLNNGTGLGLVEVYELGPQEGL